MAAEQLNVPDLGTDDAVEVIEILVKTGDTIKLNDSVVVLESDKAAMEIPANLSGVVKEILVKVGSQVKTGSPLLMLDTGTPAAAPAPVAKAAAAAAPAPAVKAESPPPPAAAKVEAPAQRPAPAAAGTTVETISIPDLGGATDVEVIDILVKVGESVQKEQGLITLETDKAAMEVPSPKAGKVTAIKIKLGDKVAQGTVILDLEIEGTSAPSNSAPVGASSDKSGASASQGAAANAAVSVPQETVAPAPAVTAAPPASVTLAPAPVTPAVVSNPGADIYAGPAVRMLARQLGVDLSLVAGTGGKGRIVKEDVQVYVKARMQSPAAIAPAARTGTGAGLPVVEDIDFSKFGAIEEVELTKLHRVTALNMSKSWLNVPHVTQFDEADITDLEAFRSEQKALADKKGIKLTPLPFIIKACAKALAEHPQFNVSLHSSGTKLIRKKYINIGVAVSTPAGLMVPVVKNVDQKSIWQIAKEVAELGAKAKDRKLTREDMEGACFTISSLGNIGGNGFTPIVNAPEVAILGVSKAAIKPVWKDSQFVPRTMLPFSLSYDHRAVNGVDGGMFCTYLATLLGDIRLMML